MSGVGWDWARVGEEPQPIILGALRAPPFLNGLLCCSLEGASDVALLMSSPSPDAGAPFAARYLR